MRARRLLASFGLLMFTACGDRSLAIAVGDAAPDASSDGSLPGDPPAPRCSAEASLSVDGEREQISESSSEYLQADSPYWTSSDLHVFGSAEESHGATTTHTGVGLSIHTEGLPSLLAGLPAVHDLAALPPGWSLRAYYFGSSRCVVPEGGMPCGGAFWVLLSRVSGRLAVWRDGAQRLVASVCLEGHAGETVVRLQLPEAPTHP